MPKSGFPDCARAARSEVVLSKILAVVALSMARSTLPMSAPVLKLVTDFMSDLRGKEAPRVRNALEFVLAALAERDAGPRDEILDRAGDQDFVGTRQGTDASGDVDGETGEIVAADFALSRVQARSHIDPDGLGCFGDGLGAMNGARRAVEAGQKTIPGRLDLLTAKAAQFVADCSVVRVQKRAPPLVAFRRGSLGGRDDVGEEYGGQNAVDLSRRSLPGEELS